MTVPALACLGHTYSLLPRIMKKVFTRAQQEKAQTSKNLTKNSL